MSVNSDSLISSYQKIDALKKQLNTPENNAWLKIIQSPEILQKRLNHIFKLQDIKQIQSEIDALNVEIETLMHSAAHHKYFNGQGIKIWSLFNSISNNLHEFKISLDQSC